MARWALSGAAMAFRNVEPHSMMWRESLQLKSMNTIAALFVLADWSKQTRVKVTIGFVVAIQRAVKLLF